MSVARGHRDWGAWAASVDVRRMTEFGSRNWGVWANGVLVEGGFFERAAAVAVADQYRAIYKDLARQADLAECGVCGRNKRVACDDTPVGAVCAECHVHQQGGAA